MAAHILLADMPIGGRMRLRGEEVDIKGDDAKHAVDKGWAIPVSSLKNWKKDQATDNPDPAPAPPST